MQPSKGLVIRVVIYSLVLAYLVGDLVMFHGPLRRRLSRSQLDSPESVAALKAGGAVARVYRYPILRQQLDRAMAERLWLEGKVAGDLTAEQLKQARGAALDELIDEELLRVAAKTNGAELPVTDAEIDAAVRRFSARFAGKEELDQALRHEGIDSEREFRFRLAAGIQRTKYVEALIGDSVKVSDEEARAWFERHAAELARPERVCARHIFLATLERDPEEAKAKLGEALGKLERKEADFAKLAAELSEDERSKTKGGDLGWLSAARLPADFTAPVFALATGKPALIRTKIGWHLVEVTDRKPAEPRSFEEAKAEVAAALESGKRREAVERFRGDLRKTAAAQIQVFDDALQ